MKKLREWTNDIPMDLILVAGLSIVLFIFLTIFFRHLAKNEEKRIRKKIHALVKDAAELTPDEFFSLRNKKVANTGKKASSIGTFSGVYVLYNYTKDMIYVGQAKDIFSRVNNHFTGHGNGDVYADYKYGDRFTVRLIALEGSGFKTLNELERNAIATYDAVGKGYNKTKGNRG